MTIPAADRSASSDWRYDPSFQWPERQPWSRLGPQFAEVFGRSDPADPQPEMIEIIGQNGSGKTHAAGKIYQERAFVQGRPSIYVVHKPVERTVIKFGWPIAHSWDDVTKLARDGYVNVVFWPRTALMGQSRKRFYDQQISDLMDRLWASATPDSPADTDLIIDDAAFAQKLPETRDRIEQFHREGRSPGFSVGTLKQRPQGGGREVNSETQWTLGFRPKDDSDLERWAELYGSKRDWMPVFRTIDRDKREFVLKHSVSQVAYISWIDEPLVPILPPRRKRGLMDYLGIPLRGAA